MDYIAFIIACVLFSLSPGSGAAVSINNVIVNGLRGASFGVIGLQSALAMHLMFIYLGIGVLVSQSPTLYNGIKYLGILYLMYLGIEKIVSSITNKNSFKLTGEKKKKLILMKEGFAVNLTNPKSIIFLTAFLPQFINQDTGTGLQYLVLGGIVVLVDGLVMFLYCFGANSFKQFFAEEKTMRNVNFLFGLIFIGIAISLAM